MPFITTLKALPFCQVDDRSTLPIAEVSAPESLHPYPIELTRAEWIEWCWRIKRWRCEWSAVWDLTEPSGAEWTRCVFSGGGTFYSPELDPEVDNETGMVCGLPLSLGAGFGDTLEGQVALTDSSDNEWTVDGLLGIGLSAADAPPRWKRHGDLWLPRCSINGNINTGLPGAGTIAFGTWDIFETAEASPVQVSLLGQDLAVWNFGGTTGAGLTGWPPVMTFVFTPAEWWPQDPGDGDGPVWDGATGFRTSRPMPDPHAA